MVVTCNIKPAEEPAETTIQPQTSHFPSFVYMSEWIICKTQRPWSKTLVPDNIMIMFPECASSNEQCEKLVMEPLGHPEETFLHTTVVYHKIWPYSRLTGFWFTSWTSLRKQSLCVFKPWIWHYSCHIFFPSLKRPYLYNTVELGNANNSNK